MPRYRSLYIEEGALAYPHARTLTAQFADRPVIRIGSYHEVFSRSGQDFQAQKRAPSLIAAVGTPPFLYDAPLRVCGCTDLPVLYNDQLRNCAYDCDYCFLQGMHASGHTLVFVNSADYHSAAAARSRDGAYWLSISYLTDALAFEPTLPLVAEWIAFARTTPRITLEVRTKGGAPALLDSSPVPNVVLTWTLSPEPIASRHEAGCASLRRRLLAIRTAAGRGWRTRIAIDPVVLLPAWKNAYARMLDTAFEVIRPETIEGATYGVFRIGADYMTRMTSARGDTPLLHHPFTRDGRTITYSPLEIDAVHAVVGTALRSRLGDAKVDFVHG